MWTFFSSIKVKIYLRLTITRYVSWNKCTCASCQGTVMQKYPTVFTGLKISESLVKDGFLGLRLKNLYNQSFFRMSLKDYDKLGEFYFTSNYKKLL